MPFAPSLNSVLTFIDQAHAGPLVAVIIAAFACCWIAERDW